MDRPDRFPRTILDICQEDDIDILVWVVTNHIAHASVVALFLCEHDVSGPINSEFYPISVHLLPVILHMVEYLGSEEGCRRLGREQGLPSIGERARCLLSPYGETGPDRWR